MADDHSHEKYCEVDVADTNTFKALEYSIKNHYWYQMFVDDLPIWGIVGDVQKNKEGEEEYFIWTHKKLEFGYNDNQVNGIMQKESLHGLVLFVVLVTQRSR